MDKNSDPESSVIFPIGQKVMNDNFLGETWLNILVPGDSTLNCSVGNVTFEAGGRNNWHKHPGGQILLVTGGRGYYQEEGKSVQLLYEGEVVIIRPGVKHWHGAQPDSRFTHLAVIPNILTGATEWLESVGDEEYYNIKQELK
jgi:Uncharacterized conserved protein, contains double-stranded beta-helix domain